jgi:hypothetical protein
MRQQQIQFVATGLKTNNLLNAYFNGARVSRFIRRSNVLVCTNITGNFKAGDVIGYKPTVSSFVKTGKILSTTNLSSSSQILYVIDDMDSTTYSASTLYNAFFDNNGTFVNSSASVSISNVTQTHYSGKIRNETSGVISSNEVQLDSKASSVNNFYTGMFFNIVSGSFEGMSTVGIGGFVKITSYNGSTKVATLGATLSFRKDDVYSIGQSNNNELKTDSAGNVSGVFYVPPSVFATGERIFRLDDRQVQYLGSSKFINYPGTEKTYAQATFIAQGILQKVVDVEYSPSISTAKGVISQERYNTFNVGRNYFDETPPPAPPPPTVNADPGIPYTPIVPDNSVDTVTTERTTFDDGSVLSIQKDTAGNIINMNATDATPDGGSAEASCFLTTAAVAYRGLKDDCYELQTLRKFRDEYMMTNDKKSDILWYYENAPRIVESLSEKENVREIYEEMWNNFILPSVRLIEKNNYKEAYDVYRNGVEFALSKSK